MVVGGKKKLRGVTAEDASDFRVAVTRCERVRAGEICAVASGWWKGCWENVKMMVWCLEQA